MLFLDFAFKLFILMGSFLGGMNLHERLQRISFLICKVEHWTCKNDLSILVFSFVSCCHFLSSANKKILIFFYAEGQVSVPQLQINLDRLVIQTRMMKWMRVTKDEGMVGH